ncbi:siderophore ABC transporter substrate-binding protein [Oceanicola sp. 502str15]|uniref:siderophore ABC transporter substrate-binding protein n=1 Tax=Oceanicola sp. 502str15 TaxID=2696061 RepID=UPI002094676F|nr:siderophore ABC transporter substrate-binding protein [Oceanicola sp. 502str15]MCO6384671.1 ABC transporter substrate-binding protein [Oceanicola sp. 502str15]
MKSFVPLAALVLLPGAVAAQSVEIETAAGPVAAPQAPETVVALDIAAIDTLSALGVTIAAVPQFTPPAYLADVFAAAQPVGSLFEPDFEALASLGPDLIVAGGRSQKQVEPLSQIAPTLDMTIGLDVVGEGKARLEAYGKLFGAEEQAAALEAKLDEAVAGAQTAAEGKGDALILLVNGGKISAYGDDSRFGWLHTTLGIPEAFPDIVAEGHGEAVSFEFVAETDPDWIFVIDRGAAIGQEGEAAAAVLDTPLVAGTKAGKAGQIVYLDPAPLYLAGGGINSMLGSIGEVTTALEGAGASN